MQIKHSSSLPGSTLFHSSVGTKTPVASFAKSTSSSATATENKNYTYLKIIIKHICSRIKKKTVREMTQRH